MIPVLFNKEETTFTSLGLGEIDATVVEVERERNGIYSLYMELPFSSDYVALIEQEMQIKADAGARTKWQTFKVNRVIKDTDKKIVKVYADHISMDTINDAMRPRVAIRQQTAEGALRQWNANRISAKQYDVSSDITTVSGTTWTIDEVENARQALGGVEGSILDVWGGEFEFDNNRIILHKEMGREAPTILEYGRNIVSLEYEELIDGVYTSIYPYANYTPRSEDNRQQEPVMVTLDELIVDGDYVGNYQNRRVQIIDFSSEFDSSGDNPEMPTQTKLRSLAKSYVKANEVGAPKITQEVDFIDLSKTLDYADMRVMEEIELNDRVPIFYPNIKITSGVKVTKTVWQPLIDQYKSITVSTIGALKSSSLNSDLKTSIKELERQQKQINNTVPYLINGQGNRIWYTMPDDTLEHKLGDTWFKKNGKYTIIYQWNGSIWEEIINDETFSKELEAQFAEIEKKTQEMTTSIAEADTKAKNALDKVGVADNLLGEHQKMIASLNGQLVEDLVTDQTVINPKTWLTNYGELVANNSYDTTDYLPVSEGDLLSLESTVSHYYKLAFYDTDKNNLGYYDGNKVVLTPSGTAYFGNTGTFNAPADGFVRLSYSTATGGADTVKLSNQNNLYTLINSGYNNALSALSNANRAMQEFGENLISYDGLNRGYWLNAQGKLMENAPYKTTDYIRVDSGERYKLTGGNAVYQVYFYDANHDAIAYYDGKSIKEDVGTGYKYFTTAPNIELIMPANASYVRIASSIVDFSQVSFRKLSTVIANVLSEVDSMKQSVENDLITVRNKANEAFDKANANGGKLTTVEQTVDDLKGEISQKVTSADVSTALNTFNETVKTQTASQITESLTGYAKSTDLNGLATEYYARTQATSEAGKVRQELTSYAKAGDLTTLAQNIRTETAESLKSVYTKTETNGLLGDKISKATYVDGIDGVKQSISSVQGKIDDLSGARNLLKESWHNSVDSPRIFNSNYLVKSWDLTEPLKLNQKYTFRVFGWVNRTGFDLHTPNAAKSLTGNLGGNTSENVIRTTDTYLPTAKTRAVWEKTFTVTQEFLNNMTANKVNLYHKESYQTGNAEVYWATLVEGTAGIDWQPAISDMISQSEFSLFKRDYEATDKLVQETLTAIKSDTGSLSTRINDVKFTADGNKTTISNVQSTLVNKADKSELSKYATTTSLNQVKQTADGNEALIAKIQKTPTSYLADYQKLINRADLVERTLGTTESAVGDNISRMVQTSGIIQQEVASMPFGGQNLIKNTEDLNGIFGSGYGGSSIKYANYTVPANEWGKDTKATRVTITNAGGTSGVFTTTNHFKMIFGRPYTLSFYVKNLGNNRIQFNLNGLTVNPNGSGSQSIYVNGGESGKVTATGYARTNPEWNWFQILPTPASGVTSMDFVIAYLQVEEGMVASDWGPAVEDTQKQLSTIVTQLDDSWGVKIKSAREAVTSINANVSGVQIKGELLNLDAKTTVAQEFWAKQVNAIKVNADNITTGTLDGSRIRANSIDTNRLTGNISEFIRTNWNSVSGTVSITGADGILTTAGDGSQTYIKDGIVGTRQPSSAGGGTVGQIGYAYESASPWYSMQVSNGSHFQIRMSRGDGQLNKQAFYIISGGTESYLNTDNIYLNPSSVGRVRVQGAMTVDKDIRAEGTVLVRQKLEYLNGGFIESQSANSNMLIASSNKLIIYTNGSNALEFDANNAVFRRKISENSDIRLKTNIVDMPINSLEAIRNIEIKKFDYLDGRKNYYGIIAQQAQQYLPELINTDSEGHLMVDKSAMTYVNMHAIQQLDKKVNTKVIELEQKIASLQEELALLKGA